MVARGGGLGRTLLYVYVRTCVCIYTCVAVCVREGGREEGKRGKGEKGEGDMQHGSHMDPQREDIGIEGETLMHSSSAARRCRGGAFFEGRVCELLDFSTDVHIPTSSLIAIPDMCGCFLNFLMKCVLFEMSKPPMSKPAQMCKLCLEPV